MISKLIRKIKLDRIWCFIAGHNITNPYPNETIGLCWRCKRRIYIDY